MDELPPLRSTDEARVHLAALYARVAELERRLRHTEKQLDTAGSPWWRRLVFRLDGWPAWWVVAGRPRWRPWRRWWCS